MTNKLKLKEKEEENKMTKLEARIESMEKEVAKLEARLQRETKILEKKTAIAIKNQVATDNHKEWCELRDSGTLTNEQKFAHLEYYSATESVKDTMKSIDKANKNLQNLQTEEAKNESKNEEINSNKVKVIEDFLDKWVEEVVKYYTEKGLLVEEYNGDAKTTTIEDIIADRNAKSYNITYKVFKHIGKITNANYLEIGIDGNLNGHVEGEKGKCWVKSIIAGGWNIQREHFRVLVEKI